MLLNRYFQISVAIITAVLLSAFTLSDNLQENAKPEPLLKDVNAEELREVIESYEGEKAVLVNVWATWCAPCIEEIPDIVEIQRKYKDRLQVIFVSADFPDSRDKALQFLKEQNVDWTTYFKTGDDQEFIEVISDDWTGALPFSKILNKEGEVVASWEKSATFSKFDKHVKRALND
jgi:thiol-disulfide isomerase/thioredoxin